MSTTSKSLPQSLGGGSPSATSNGASADTAAGAEHLPSGDVLEWTRRAEWLESEARSHHRDPAARARLLLAASEVRALCGARDDARRLAIQAAGHSTAPAFASRQARALQQLHGDFTAVVKHLAKEAEAVQAPAARAHAQYVMAEVLRLIQRDAAGASTCLAAAEQYDPQDYRVTLQRLVAQLAESQKPPEICVRPDDAVKALRLATGQLRQLRGAGAPRAGTDDENLALPLLSTQRALARGRLSEAADAIDRLQSQDELRSAVSWLSTLWRASSATRPQDALLLLRDLVRQQPGRQERRALAARALGEGNWHMLEEALSGDVPRAARDVAGPAQPPSSRPGSGTDQSYPAFSSIERASLMALMARPAEAAPVSQSPVEDLALKPFASAIERMRALTEGVAKLPVRGGGAAMSPAEIEFTLGRAAANLQAFSELEAGEHLAQAGALELVIQLEQSREAKDFAGLARALPQLMTAAAAQPESNFVAATFAERAGELDAARWHYAAALSGTTREAATRALATEGREAAATLRALSAHARNPLQRAMLLTEALFRLAPDAPEFDALADEAARTFPELPFAHHLGELSARMRGDRLHVARWLSRQRERAKGAGDYPLAAIREALFAAPTDPREAAERLQEAADRGAPDLALQHLIEGLVDPGPVAKADFRRRVAPLLGPRGRAHFLAEAVALYESGGDIDASIATARELGGVFGELWVERFATRPEDLDWLSASLCHQAQQTRDVALACDLYDHLARLARARGEREQALSWQAERLKKRPGSLDALRFLELDSSARGQETELERWAAALFERLGESDGIGYAFLAARLKIDRGAFQEARAIVGRASTSAAPPPWALRLEAVYARDEGDDRALLAVYRSLREGTTQPLDAAILSLRACEAAARLGQTGLAKDEIQRALALSPDNVVILSARAELLRSNADYAEAADAFEALASTTQSNAQRLDALYQAALLWLDTLGDRARGMLALQEAATVDSPHAGLLARLRELHAQSEDFEGLGELIERQSSQRPEPGGGADVEMARALALANSGHVEEAREVLTALVSREPLHTEALNALAELHLGAGEAAAAEKCWRRIVERAPRGRWRSTALHALSALYENELPDLARAAAVYVQILQEDASDASIRKRLIQALLSLGRVDEAVHQQRELLQRALSDEERRERLLDLVPLLGGAPSGRREAEALLEQAHRTWPEDTRVLEAEVHHYTSTGQQGTARVITERATNSSRNAILAGRLEPALFEMLELAARLGGDPDTAYAARAGLGALLGQPSGTSGAGARAGAQDLDDLTAPAPLSAGFRKFLYSTGAAIERAYALDPWSLEPSPVDEHIATEVRRLASWFGHDGVRVVASARAGADCLCLPSSPIYVVLGQRLLEHDNPLVREFLIVRALKIAAANACALSRMAPADLWSAVAGFLACFAPAWHADGTDAQRLIAARNKIRPHITTTPDPDLIALTSALSASVLPQAAVLGDAISRWASRVGLLAVGDPSIAVESLWTAANLGHAMPADLDTRVRWLAGSSHARDLVGYGISDAYMEALKRAGSTLAPR